MLKAMFVCHKRAGMTLDEFRRYWKETHGPIVVKVPGVRKYVQNHALPDAAPGVRACDGVAELWFDSAEALQAALASPAGAAALADVPNFMDMSKSGLVVVDEVSVIA
jgi:uncharacterized protein (TIGR02118 family)